MHQALGMSDGDDRAITFKVAILADGSSAGLLGRRQRRAAQRGGDATNLAGERRGSAASLSSVVPGIAALP
jgi:hypothetical protein